MGWEAWATIIVVAGMLYLLAREWAGPDFILAGGMVLLMSFNLFSDKFPSPREMASMFGNEGLLTVGVLFIIAAGLTETGGLGLVTERLLGRPKSVVDAQVRMMFPVAGISAFLNNTPVVAMFMPVIHDWCKKTGLNPSKLFIPLSYAAILGGCCTLIGTSTNLVVQGLLIEANKTDPSVQPMGFFTIGAVGVPAAICGLLFILLTSKWLLPDRRPASQEMGDPRQYTVEMLVQPDSAIDGETIEQAGLRHLPGAYLMEIQRNGETLVAVGPDVKLRGEDRLIFAGVVGSVVDLQKIRGLVPATDQVFKLNDPRHERCLVEAVVSSTNPLAGKTIRESRFRTHYDAAVIAVCRSGQRLDKKIGDITLDVGDTLLLETHPRFIATHGKSRDFFLVSAVEDSHVRRHERAWIAIVILIGMVLAMASETFFPLIPGLATVRISVFTAALVAAAIMLLTRCLSGAQARRSIDWSVLIAIGAALGIGRAMETTGAAGFLADRMIGVFKALGPWGVLAGVYLLTLVFTEIITNNAAAALAFPIAKAAADGMNVSFAPFAIIIAVAASSGFATPLGYATHLMVYGPGGYRFSDFLKIGIPLDILIGIVAVGLAPFVFPF